MAGSDASAVRDRVEKTLAPIPRHVEADGPPEIAGAAEGEAEKEADADDGRDADFCFAGIDEMHGSEEKREERGGRPEMHSPGEDPLRIATREEVFEDGSDEKEDGVVETKLDDARAV